MMRFKLTMVTRHLTRKNDARVLSLFVLILLLSGCKDPFEGHPHLPDDQLIASFQAHKTEFEQLRLMILQDKGLTRVDDNWTAPTDPTVVGVKPERIAEYRGLFQRMDLVRGFSAASKRGEIKFLASCKGWVAHGSEKGYVYTTKRLESLVDTLDQYSSQRRPVGYDTAISKVTGTCTFLVISESLASTRGLEKD